MTTPVPAPESTPTPTPEKKKGGKGKLILGAVVGLVVIAALAGQGGTKNPGSSGSNQTSAPNQLATTQPANSGGVTARLNEPATIEGVTITIKKVETSTGTEFFKPAAGHVYVGYLINYKAGGEEQFVSSGDWTALSDGTKQGQWTITGVEAWQPTLPFDQLRPNAETEGWVVFEVPQPSKFVRLEFSPSFFTSESSLTFDATVAP